MFRKLYKEVKMANIAIYYISGFIGEVIWGLVLLGPYLYFTTGEIFNLDWKIFLVIITIITLVMVPLKYILDQNSKK
jgi:hypothetical protein